MKKQFKPTGRGNETIDIGKAFVSYNPNIPENIFDNLLVAFGEAEDRTGQDETALRYNGVWYILNGDFRKDYLKCKTEEECLEVYNKYKEEFRSDFSTD